MEATPTMASPAMTSTTPVRDVQLGDVVRSVVECSFRPATAAKRTLGLPLTRAYAVHLMAGLLAVAAMTLIASWVDAESPATPRAVAIRFLALVGLFVDQFLADPKTTILIVLGIALLVELGGLGLAMLTMPWGASDEPLLDSFTHALRRVWMQTPQVLLGIVLIGSLAAHLGRGDQAWNASVPFNPPPMPPLPTGIRVGTPEWDEYDQQMDAYWAKIRRLNWARRQAKPWYLRHHEAILLDGSFACGVWFLASLVRTVGVSRETRPIARPPRCEACGYDLTTLPMESRCPECGEAVIASLGPTARPGTPWQDPGLDRWVAWRRTWATAIFRPMALGRTLRLQSPGVEHRRFLLLHLPAVFLIGAISVPTLFMLTSDQNAFPRNADVVLMGSPVFGTLCVVGATAVSLSLAGWAGIYHYWRNKRNVMPAAIQVTCYLVPYLIAWELFGAVTGISAAALSMAPWFKSFAAATRMDADGLLFLLWFVPNLACGIVYWSLVRRGVAGARYANR